MASLTWKAVTINAAGAQEHLRRDWPCDPAWSIYALHREPDGELPHPKQEKQYVFWNRHLDPRFHIDYPPSRRDQPRTVGTTIGDPLREWDTVQQVRDRYLADAGLTLQSPPIDIARCLANTFRADSYFKDKPSFTAFGKADRALINPVEGLLHQSFCVGCAHALAVMADMSGLTSRTVGLGAHRIAEIRIDGRWHMTENSCRHPGSEDLAAFMPAGFMEVALDPAAYPEHVPARKVLGYLGAPNPQYHFLGGSWQCPQTLRFAGQCAKALYPEVKRIGFKSLEGRRVPLTLKAEGFYWEDGVVNSDREHQDAFRRRQATYPCPVSADVKADMLFAPLPPGGVLRQSVWLDNLDPVTGLEVVIPLAPEPQLRFDDSMGRQLVLSVNGKSASLADRGAWPPAEVNNRGMRNVTVVVPRDSLQGEAVNWIELRNAGTQTLAACFIPAALEPYVPPLALT